MQSSKLWNYEITDETGVSETFTSECIATSNLQKAANLPVESNNQTNDQIDSRSVTEIRETMSRSQGKSSKDKENGFKFSESIHSKSGLKSMQEKDPDIGSIYRWVTTGNRPHGNDMTLESPETRHYWILWDSLRLVDGLLYKQFLKRDGTGDFLQFLAPKCLRAEIMQQLHNSLQGGHLGQKKTRERILQRYFWFEMKIDINNWVLKCDACAANRKPTHTPRAPLGNMKVGGVLDRLSIDILRPLIETPRGNRYILVATCHFSKWVEIFHLPDQTAVTCARVLLNEVFARYGTCTMLLADQGRMFEGSIFQEICRLLEIKKSRTSVRNPKCNCQTERFNRTLIRMIKAYLKDEQTDWDLNLGCLAGAYRASQNESTQLTPNLLFLGREVRIPTELLMGSAPVCKGEVVS